MKQLTAWLLSLVLLFTMLCPVLAEEEDEEGEEVSAELLQESMELDAIDDDEVVYVSGPTYHEPDAGEFTTSSPAVYTAKTINNCVIYLDRSIESTRIVSKDVSQRVDVLSVGVVWCVVRHDGRIGYIKRDKLTAVEALDPVHTPPYGVLKSTYIATTAAPCHVYKSMSTSDATWVVLNPGSKISLWKIVDGWGIVIYMRNYGYIPMQELTALTPVSQTDTPIRADAPIAAYTSFYKMAQTEANVGRIHNIGNASERLSRVYQPGEELNYNKQIGPFTKGNGYQKAPVLVNGETVLGSGGGVCQVSSTLYNVLLQLPHVTILQRRPHGPGGASYLPHGVDAASGGKNLNFRFRNDYPFPIRIEAQSMSDGALFMAVYRADITLTASN